MSADLLEQLEHIVDEPVTPMAPDRVAHIEAALRAPRYPLRRNNVRRRVAVRAGIAAAIAALLALVALNIGGDSVRRTDLVLTSASKTVVVMPDGTRVAGRAGLVLPDGARVIVEPGGHASIGDTEIAGGSTAIVDDGEVEVLLSTPTSRSTSRGQTPSSPPKTRIGASPTTTASATPPPPVPRTSPPVTGPSTTASPTTIAPRRRTRRCSDSAPSRPCGAIASPCAGRHSTEARAAATQSSRRTESTPRYPPGAGAVVVARTTDETSATIAARRGMRVLVVALSADNRILAASSILTPS